MMENDCLKNKIPEIYCALSIIFKKDADVDGIITKLNQIGIKKIEVCEPKCDSVISFDIAIINNECFWYLDDALSKMFANIDNSLNELKEVANELGGKFCVDVAIYQFGIYPALEFFGENMQKIRFLNADISIDAYDII